MKAPPVYASTIVTMLHLILRSSGTEYTWVGVGRLKGGDDFDININIELWTRGRTDRFDIGIFNSYTLRPWLQGS
jgi:hypothetical protein